MDPLSIGLLGILALGVLVRWNAPRVAAPGRGAGVGPAPGSVGGRSRHQIRRLLTQGCCIFLNTNEKLE
jgi:hypothetical protein